MHKVLHTDFTVDAAGDAARSEAKRILAEFCGSRRSSLLQWSAPECIKEQIKNEAQRILDWIDRNQDAEAEAFEAQMYELGTFVRHACTLFD